MVAWFWNASVQAVQARDGGERLHLVPQLSEADFGDPLDFFEPANTGRDEFQVGTQQTDGLGQSLVRPGQVTQLQAQAMHVARDLAQGARTVTGSVRLGRLAQGTPVLGWGPLVDHPQSPRVWLCLHLQRWCYKAREFQLDSLTEPLERLKNFHS